MTPRRDQSRDPFKTDSLTDQEGCGFVMVRYF